MRLNALRQRRAALIDEAKALFAAATKDDRSLTVDEQARDEAIEQEIAGLDADIARVERQLARERSLTQAIGGQIEFQDDGPYPQAPHRQCVARRAARPGRRGGRGASGGHRRRERSRTHSPRADTRCAAP